MMGCWTAWLVGNVLELFPFIEGAFEPAEARRHMRFLSAVYITTTIIIALMLGTMAGHFDRLQRECL